MHWSAHIHYAQYVCQESHNETRVFSRQKLNSTRHFLQRIEPGHQLGVCGAPQAHTHSLPPLQACQQDSIQIHHDTGKNRVESFFDLLIDYSIVACDLQWILPLENHSMILQSVENNHLMIFQSMIINQAVKNLLLLLQLFEVGVACD